MMGINDNLILNKCFWKKCTEYILQDNISPIQDVYDYLHFFY